LDAPVMRTVWFDRLIVMGWLRKVTFEATA
jgi:hypothetical protein